MDFYLVEKLINYFALGLMGSYHKIHIKSLFFSCWFHFKAIHLSYSKNILSFSMIWVRLTVLTLKVKKNPIDFYGK